MDTSFDPAPNSALCRMYVHPTVPPRLVDWDPHLRNWRSAAPRSRRGLEFLRLLLPRLLLDCPVYPTILSIPDCTRALMPAAAHHTPKLINAVAGAIAASCRRLSHCIRLDCRHWWWRALLWAACALATQNLHISVLPTTHHGFVGSNWVLCLQERQSREQQLLRCQHMRLWQDKLAPLLLWCRRSHSSLESNSGSNLQAARSHWATLSHHNPASRCSKKIHHHPNSIIKLADHVSPYVFFRSNAQICQLTQLKLQNCPASSCYGQANQNSN